MMSEDSLENLKSFHCAQSVTKFELAHKHFNRLFLQSHKDLNYLLDREFPLDEPQIIEKRLKAVCMVSKLYLKYVQVTNKLIKCYENLANPQKRRYLRKMCDACIGRCLELKHELVSLEMSDFHYLDHILLGIKMFPHEMELKIPEYFKDDVSEEEKQRKKVVESLLEERRCKILNENAVTKEEKTARLAMVFTRTLQRHERARQAREEFRQAQKKYLMKEFLKQRDDRKPVTMSRTSAVVVMQRTWRKYHYRKVLRSKIFCEMEFLKMVQNKGSKDNNIISRIEEDRKSVIRRNEEDYLRERDTVMQDMLTYIAPRLAEDLEERIWPYFLDYKDINGVFPTFPTEEEGGSKAMLAIAPERANEPLDATETSTKSEAKNEKSEKSTKSAKTSKKSEPDEDSPTDYKIKPSKYTPIISKLMEEYLQVWISKELLHLDKFDLKLMTSDVRKEVEHLVRLQVDEKMRGELLRLSEALQKDSKRKQKKGKKKKEKGKKKKGKPEIDLTPDRSLESLVEELVEEGIIIDYPECSLEDFLGEYNYSGSVLMLSRDEDNEPLPCLSDIRRVINEYCILPMGSEAVHLGGAYIKSILIAGPHSSGKKLLVRSICNEIGATMIDLSAENLENKYAGEEGLEMLMHLVLKVSKLLQPTLIYIKDAENYFWKKKPPTTTLTEPGRLKKELPKLIKKLKDTDRVLVCGTTVSPFDVDLKKLGSCYSKIICIFKPDFNCRSKLWREFVAKAGGSITDSNLNVLSSISDGFTASQIQNAVGKVLTKRRLGFQKDIPLCPLDFIFSLAENTPVYDEQHKEYQLWLKKLPLGKKRISLYKKEREEEPEDISEEDGTEEDDY